MNKSFDSTRVSWGWQAEPAAQEVPSRTKVESYSELTRLKSELAELSGHLRRTREQIEDLEGHIRLRECVHRVALLQSTFAKLTESSEKLPTEWTQTRVHNCRRALDSALFWIGENPAESG